MISLQQAALGFAAAGSDHRLEVLRCLVRAGPDGLTVSQIQSRTGMPASTLAHHLRFLSEGGLIRQQRQGRSVVNRADFETIQLLAGFLMRECCADMKDPDHPDCFVTDAKTGKRE